MSALGRFGKYLFSSSHYSSISSLSSTPFPVHLSSHRQYRTFRNPISPPSLYQIFHIPLLQYSYYFDDEEQYFHQHDPDLVDNSGYPVPEHKYINDFMSLISDEDSRYIIDELHSIFDETGIEMTVLTISSIDDYPVHPNQTLESFSTELFNTWGIGDKTENDGILLLVALHDRTIRIEVGAGYSVYFNGQMEKVIYQNMVPYFKREDFSRGIVEGVKGVISVVTVDEPSAWDWVKVNTIFEKWLFYTFTLFFLFKLFHWLRKKYWEKKGKLNPSSGKSNRSPSTNQKRGRVYFDDDDDDDSSSSSRSYGGGGGGGGGSFGGGSSSGGGGSGKW